MRYDVEVSGFPSSHAGHLCLLRLEEDDYPGTTRIEEWPSWDLPVLQVGQGARGRRRLLAQRLGPAGAGQQAAQLRHAAVRRHRRQRIHRRRGPRRVRLHLGGRHADRLGAEHLVSHAQLRLPLPDQRRDRLPLHLRRARRPGPGLRQARPKDEPLDFDDWVEGISDGRSYCCDGLSHLIDFTVERPGRRRAGRRRPAERAGREGRQAAEGQASTPRRCWPTSRATTSASTPLDQKPYWHVERARIGDTPQGAGRADRQRPVGRNAGDRRPTASVQDLTFDYTPEQSSWVALRIFPSSHTNPVFVEVDGKPIRASKQQCRVVPRRGRRLLEAKVEADARRANRTPPQAAYEVARQGVSQDSGRIGGRLIHRERCGTELLRAVRSGSPSRSASAGSRLRACRSTGRSRTAGRRACPTCRRWGPNFRLRRRL